MDCFILSKNKQFLKGWPYVEISFCLKIVFIWRYIASSRLYKVVVMKLFIDGAYLCLIVLYAWDSGAQGRYGGS